jgi:23S rRNA A1618 N6-methylase RlmF
MMATSQSDYWKECISLAAEECDLTLTPEQLACLADGAESGHEHYSMSFYEPPWTDRLGDIEREHKARLKEIQAELERYQRNAEEAIKRALRVHRDDQVSIGEHGEVLRHGGRTERIQ